MIEIIPAIDLMDGRCVRLSQGDFARKKVYGNDPVDIAKAFEAAGIRRLHIVDLDGARTGSITNLKVLERIGAETSLTSDFGGGVKTEDDVRAVLDAGASMVSIGSAAVKHRERFLGWTETFGRSKFLLGADVRDGKIAIDGWQTETEFGIVEYLRELSSEGITRAFVTDISKDGLLEGASVRLYRKILEELPGFELIASGGVSRIEDVVELAEAGVSGVIIGKAIYEGLVDPGKLVALTSGSAAD